jgi:2-keto-4-pentenoate hydratase
VFLQRLKQPSLLILLALCACTSTQERAVNDISAAWRDHTSLPQVASIDETLTIEAAYRIQTRVVRERLNGERPAGFKAGLTSAATQARFKTNGPVAGVLYVQGARRSGDTLRLSELRGLTLETEVAFRIGADITKKLPDIAALQRHIDGIAPAIELPDLDYRQPQQLRAADIVATNVAAAAYIVGEFVEPARRDPNAAAPKLVCAGREVNAGTARDALGDQWQAALWLVNTMIEQGWKIERGQVLLTGALGRALPAQSGHCVANYGEWGELEFNVTN